MPRREDGTRNLHRDAFMVVKWLNYSLHNVQRCQVSTNSNGLDGMKFVNDEIGASNNAVHDWAKVFKIVFMFFSFSLYPDTGHLASSYIFSS